jgi:hypothetical protein
MRNIKNSKFLFKGAKISRGWRKSIVALVFIFLTTATFTTIIGIADDTSHPTMLRYTFSFEEPQLDEMEIFNRSFTSVQMPGCMAIGRSVGAPNIPVKFVKLLLPPGSEVVDVDVTGVLTDVTTRGFDLKEKPVVPHQKPVPIVEELPPKDSASLDENIYHAPDFYPSEIFKNQGVGYCRGYEILTIALNPINYRPALGQMYYYPELTVEIELKDTGNVDQFYRNNINDEEWVRKLVYNSEVMNYYHNRNLDTFDYPGGICNPSEDYDYVIITTTQNGLDHWTTDTSKPYNWTSLMDKHSSDDGLSCTLVTMQDINAESDYWNTTPLFNDTAAHIREFCRDAYQDWGTEYVFVGGDDEWIPAREMDYDYESNCDSDLYWSNLHDTFNDDGDNDWGEEGDTGFDLYSELYIGRITCDTPQDVSNWMKKSFYYADSTFKDYLENAAFYGCVTGWNCHGDDFIDYSAIQGTSNWLGPTPGAHGAYPTWLGFQYGFETWNAQNPGQEYNLSVKWSANSVPNPGWQGGSESAAIAGMKNAINNDDVTLISGIAHANSGMSLDVYDTSWEADYHNTMPFLIHDYGCHCGDMDAEDDGVLHSMLFHSDTELAFACVYHTSYGWGSQDDTNSSSAVQQKLFWDYFFDTVNNSGNTMNWQLGKAHAFSKDAMAPMIDWTYTGAPGSWRGTIEACLLFGDPAQRIKPPIQPEHNIGIQSLDFPSHAPANADIWVNATVYNNGRNNETNVTISFYVDRHNSSRDLEFENSTNISFFEKGTTEQVGWVYHTPSEGWETFYVNVTMVSGENISEDNERFNDVIFGPDIAVSSIQAPDFIGQGFARPVEGYVQNLGPTNENVNVQLIANNTIVNSTIISLNSGDNSMVTFMWDATTSGLGVYNVTIHAVPVANESYLINQNRSLEVEVFSAIGNILLVDDDGGDSYESWYETALLMSNYVYERYDTSTQPVPSASFMQGYTAVVWFTGHLSTTLTTDEKNSLSTYLDNGGKLFITGQDIGYDIHSDADNFYSNYLHANYLADTAGWDVDGEVGDPIGDGLSFGISSGDGANNQDWPDGIEPIGNATSCFYYNGTAYKAGIKVSEGLYRVVYFGFGFEAINNMEDRNTVMSRILGWLAAEHEIGVTNLDILDYVPHNETQYVKATIMNGGINDETSIEVNFTVNGSVMDTTIIGSLNAGQSQLVSFAWDPAVGVYNVGIEATPVPGENFTANNALHKTVHVIPASDIWISPTEFNFNLNEGVEIVDTLVIGNEPTAEGNLTFNISYAGEWGGGWIEQWSYTYGNMGHSQLAQPVGDIDEDGHNETIVGGYASGGAHILSYNSLLGTYEEEHFWTHAGGTYDASSGACVVDLDNSGDLELVVSWEYSGADGIHAYDWDGTTLTQLDYYSGTGYTFAFDVYACDYDEDGDVEVLIANDNRNGGTAHVTALGWSSGSFVYETSWGSGETTENPMIWSGDTDNDGHIEVIASGSANKVYALNWNGTAWNADVVASGLPSHPYAIVAGDIDNDGIDEIGIGLEGTDAYVYDWDGSSYVQVWHSNYPGEDDIIEAMYFGDADNDGQMELLVGTDDVHVIAYSSGQYYEESVITQTDGQLSSAIIADMDDDGKNEVKACDIITGPGKEWIMEFRDGWVSDSPESGNIVVGNSMNLDVTVDTTGLAEGTYHAFIVIATNDLDEPIVYVPVNLSVVFEDDVGAISVNYPTGENPVGLYTVNASFENFGSDNHTVPVNCSIYESGGGYFADFESDDGGWVASASWDPIGDWEWTDSYDYGSYSGSYNPPPAAYSGDGLWATVPHGDYSNSGGYNYLSQTFDFTGFTNAEISWYNWCEIFYSFDTAKLFVEGTLVYERTTDSPPSAWEFETVDLSAWDGQASVEIVFELYATTVVERAGWYIDDVSISSSLSREPGDLIYQSFDSVYIPAYSTAYVEFSPSWNAASGHYVIKVSTMLPGDQDTSNDLTSQSVTMTAGNDVGAVTINYPLVEQRPGYHTVNATIENFGIIDQTTPVNCSIYNSTHNLVYGADTSVFVSAMCTVYVEFSPPWYVSTEGDYLINVTTRLTGDECDINNATEANVTIKADMYLGDIQSRWNFISVPFNKTIDKTQLFVYYNGTDYNWTEATDPANGPLIDSFIFGWNRGTGGQTYQAVDALEPGYGYWMYAYSDCELWARGLSDIITDNYVTGLDVNWNIMGIPYDLPVDKNTLIISYNGTDYNWTEAIDPANGPLVDTFIFGWNRGGPSGQTYQAVDTLEPGYSYWMYAYYPCILKR